MAKPDRREEIEAAMKTANEQGWQLAVVVLNDVPPQVYECVKQLGNQRLGVVTQCVSFQALERNSGKLRMCKSLNFLFVYDDIYHIFLDVQNLSQKINAKLGGINGIVNLKAALSHSTNEDRFMFFGADVKPNDILRSYVLTNFYCRSPIQRAQQKYHPLQQLLAHVIQLAVVMRHVFVNVCIQFIIYNL
jgi:hypothetical protein